MAFALFIRHVASFTSFVSIFYRACVFVCTAVCVCFLQHLFRAERQLLVFCLPSFCFVARYHCCCSCSFFATPSTDMCSCLPGSVSPSLSISPSLSFCVCACYLLDSCVQFMQDLGTHTLQQQHLVPHSAHNFCICYKFQMDFSVSLSCSTSDSLSPPFSLIFYVFAHGIRYVYVYVSLRFGRGLFGFGSGCGCIHMH